MNEDYDEGYAAFLAGVDIIDAPNNWLDGHDMHPDSYYQWCGGWYQAETDSKEIYD